MALGYALLQYTKMSKSIRNTVFTAALLALTGFGVSWNEEVARQQTPVAIGQSVLAEFSGREQTTGTLQLETELSRDTVLLGQYQVVTIRTAPFAELDLALQRPTGEFDTHLTRQAEADELGVYRWRFLINDFELVGSPIVLVKAGAGDQYAASRRSFTVQTWSSAEPMEEARHPIIP